MRAYKAAEVYPHSFLTTVTEISGLFPPSPALPPVKEPPKMNEYVRVGPRVRPDAAVERNIPCPPGIEPKFLSLKAHSLDITPTVLPLLVNSL
jgi:hypothetical protein